MNRDEYLRLRRLQGKRLKKIRLHPFSDDCGETTYDPELIFEDGSSLRFTVHETDYGSEYGIDPVVYPWSSLPVRVARRRR